MTTIDKPQLLGFILESDKDTLSSLLQTCNKRLGEISDDALNAGFTPFQRLVVKVDSEHGLKVADIVDWMATRVSRLSESDILDKPVRNAKTYQIELLGEFAATIRAKLRDQLPSYEPAVS